MVSVTSKLIPEICQGVSIQNIICFPKRTDKTMSVLVEKHISYLHVHVKVGLKLLVMSNYFHLA